MESWLARLAEDGLVAFPPAELSSLARWCREYCWASGHVAYCVLSDLFWELHVAWEGPIRLATADAMTSVLARDIPAILESGADTGRVVALALREEILHILSSQPR